MAGAWRAALAGGEAGRWWGVAAERPAQAGRAAARGPAQRRPAAALGQPRWRGVFPAAAAWEPNGERAGEVEWTTGKLTTSSNRAEKGLRWFVDGRAELRWRTSMAAGGLELDPAGFGLNRARGGAEQVRGEARELRA